MSKFSPQGKILGALVGVAAILATVVTVTTHDRDTVEMTAVFANAAELVKGGDVRSSGVAVGKIESISLKDNLAQVKFRVNKEVLPIHQDAKADDTTKDVLGERYLSLDTGSPSSPVMAEPLVIGPANTTRAVELQEVLNVVNKPTGTALAGLVTTLGEGVGGNGKQVAATIAAVQPAMTHTDELVRILTEQNKLLTSLVDKAQPVAQAAATDQGQQLDKLVGSTTKTLSVVAKNRAATRDTLQRLPDTLASAQARLAQVAGVADPATQTLKSLRPVTNDLSDISGELRRFSDAADPALGSLPPVLKKGDEMLKDLGPVVRALKPAGPGLRDVASSLEALSREGPLHHRLVDLLEFAKGWALATKDYDAISHYFKAVTPYSGRPASQLALGPVPGAPSRPEVADLPMVPGPGTLQLPGNPGGNEQPPSKANGEDVGAARQRDDKPRDDKPRDGKPRDGKPRDGATGLTPEQENNMVGQMLGGGR